jgi:hypothetical protein
MLELSDDVLLALGVAMGLAGLASGVLVRRGRLRYQLANYFDSSESLFFRRLPLVEIPAGMALTLACTGIVLTRMTGRVWDIGMILFGLGLLSAGLSLAWLARPPAFMKPRWLVEREPAAVPDRIEGIVWTIVAIPLGTVTGLLGTAALLIGISNLFSRPY